MSKLSKVILGVALLPFLVVGVLLGAVLLQDDTEHVISEATSPDGTWSVAVVADTRFGSILEASYDIEVHVRNAAGERLSAFVIGMEGDLDALSEDFTVVFESNELARIGAIHEVNKSFYFPEDR